jgi:hypothetical protein
MATRSKLRPATDEAILQERERSNQAVFRLIESWCRPEDEPEQRETLAYLKRALDEDRPADRKFFPWDEPVESLRREFEASGMTEEELVRFLAEVRDEARKERRRRKPL